ncbi:MAG: prepilin-type N-terminal cleavage/methylation domain-containing protein [Candidatus Omnitrophota bacterium]
MKNKKGFTLIEVLIVVVIIAILAALLLPRLTAAPEKARVAEGMQTLGAVRRAQLVNMDAANASALNFTITNGTSHANWTALGFSDLGAASLFNYQCDGTSCIAIRVSNTSKNISMNIQTGAITCNGYTPVASGGVNVSCTA